MILDELKQNVDNLVEHGFGKNEVLITLNDVSVGGRASVGFDYIYNGFDWEQGQIRIEPKKKIISYDKDRDSVIEPIITHYNLNGRNSTILSCKKCGSKLRKNDRYCCYCGQRCKK